MAWNGMYSVTNYFCSVTTHIYMSIAGYYNINVMLTNRWRCNFQVQATDKLTTAISTEMENSLIDQSKKDTSAIITPRKSKLHPESDEVNLKSLIIIIPRSPTPLDDHPMAVHKHSEILIY